MKVLLLFLMAAFLPLAATGSDFADDVAFLRARQSVLVLSSPDGASAVAVVPAYQGRVMTSTAGGEHGFSFGFINRALIAAGKIQPHINAYGGEDRLWLGPEGGPFSLFFARSAPAQTLPYWQTPPLVDTAAWKVVESSPTRVRLAAADRLTNRAGTVLAVSLERTVRLLDRAEAGRLLGAAVPAGLQFVGYESENLLRNAGDRPWTRAGGLPSLWVLGMFQAGPRSTTVVPYRTDAGAEVPVIHGDYFGPIGPDRLRVADGAIYFRGDAHSRGKIGVPPARARPILGSWDAARGVLTLIQFDLPDDAARRPYVDSRWIDMPDPYDGDAVNAYNDGPPAPGQPQLGNFYELETSSPAAELAPGAALVHRHRTFHFQGDRAALDRLCRATLGVSLSRIESSFETK